MAIERAPAYVTAVSHDRTVHLPAEIPTGAGIAIVVLSPDDSSSDEEARRARIAATYEAARATSEQTPA